MPPSLTPRRLPVFLCYAHKDNEGPDPARRWLDRLLEHLEPLSLQEQVAAFSDKEIEAGADWHDAIQQSLKAARVAVLLVSPSFLASRYIRNSELPVLLRRARDEGLVILPLILRPCMFAETRFRYPDPHKGPEEFLLASLQAANSPSRPLSGLSEHEQDEVLVQVAQRLLKEVRRQDRPVAPAPPPVQPDPPPAPPPAASPARLPAPGDRIGKYRVDRVLGQGGMGVVYAATHEELGAVAIKLLHPHLSADAGLAARFLNEARAAAGLHDPGIVRVHDCGQIPSGAAYLVMEYLWGESLGARLAGAPGPQPGVLPLLQQVAAVLSVVHGRGVVHRDLKPDNVMIIPDAAMPGGERVKVLDFGIAKLSAEQAGSAGLRGATQTGAMMGTPFYMAPEQCQDAKGVTDRADVYSLGVMLYKALAGRLPFAAESLPALIGIYLRRELPAPLATLGVAPALSALVEQMLGYDPVARPSMTQVRERMEQALRPAAPPIGEDVRPRRREAKRDGGGPPLGWTTKTWRTGAAALGAVGLLSGAGLAIHQCPSGKPGLAVVDMRPQPIAIAPAPMPDLALPGSRAATPATTQAPPVRDDGPKLRRTTQEGADKPAGPLFRRTTGKVSP